MRSEVEPMNLHKGLIYLVSLIILVCIGLVISETLLRYVYPQTLGVWTQTRDGLILLRPSSDVYLQKFGTHVHTNTLGFRDVEHDLDKKVDTYRILLLGDSFMEALQVEFMESLPHLLEKNLNKMLACRVEVINASVSGWGTDDELTYLIRRGMRLHPDLVLFAATLHNDVSDNLEERYHLTDGKELLRKSVVETPLLPHINLEIRSLLVSHSHLYQLIYQAWKSVGRVQAGNRLTGHVIELMRVEQGEMARKGWWVTRKLMSEANQFSRINGAQMAVFGIPLIYQIDERAYADLLEANHLREGEFDRNKPREMLLKALQEESISSIDLFPEFQRQVSVSGGQQLYIKGDGHWNREGHRIAASIVSSQVAGIIRNSESSSNHCRA